MYPKADKTLQIGLLIVAAILAVFMNAFWFIALTIGHGVNDSGPLISAFSLVPFFELPLFLVAFKSLKIFRLSVWIAAAANLVGGVFMLQASCATRHCLQANPVVNAGMMIVGAAFFPHVALSILIAVLVEYSCRLKQQENSQDHRADDERLLSVPKK